MLPGRGHFLEIRPASLNRFLGEIAHVSAILDAFTPEVAGENQDDKSERNQNRQTGEERLHLGAVRLCLVAHVVDKEKRDLVDHVEGFIETRVTTRKEAG